ncbi:FliG C-terminal domain-containing protein [Gymnodinialimonas sp. 2305UL16-5]|uniref:FliG C-terminal domain-containing protein n=1 Tax=Gymnodinialimonas mytili TaxID=3126503 RepID=UPI0030A34784
MGLQPDFQGAASMDGSSMTIDAEVGTGAGAVDITPRRLRPQQKAAVIVRLLLGRGVSPGVGKLDSHHQRKLAHAIGQMRNIDRATLMEVVREFTAEIDNLALSFPEGLEQALALLEPHISNDSVEALRSELTDSSDPWALVSRQPEERLRPLFDTESAEVCAVLLSKLNVSTAAKLLSDLPEDRAEVLAHTVALTETITPDLVHRIGVHLSNIVSNVPSNAFKKPAADRVGAILNSFGKDAREKVLEGLVSRDSVFASGVKRAIFAFGHIPQRVQPGDVGLITRDVPQDVLIPALAAGMEAEPLAVEFLLENMSKRLAEQLRDEAESGGTPTEEDGAAAMAAVVAAIRTLEERGELKLIAPDD